MQSANRHLDWEGCYNVRDLGGLATADGRETRWRAVIRSDHLGRLTARGQQAMLDYGVRTVIDVRAPSETVESPSVSALAESVEGFAYLNLPMLNWEPGTQAIFRQVTSQAQAYSIVLDRCRDNVVRIMRAVIDAQPGGVVLHCHSGKDRTGQFSALLLRLAGVTDEAIADDFYQSRERLLVWMEDTGGGHPGQPDMWSPRAIAAQTMLDVLAYLDDRYGGVEAYLEGGGLSFAERERLRSRLVGDSRG
jgi:protein-tyrosine phosphatase